MTGREAVSGKLDRSHPPPAGELRPLKLPEIRSFRLEGGLDVHVVELPQLPEVSLRLIVEAGAAGEPREGEGVAELTGRLLSEGADGRSAMEVAAWLDRIGAAFRVSTGYDVCVVAMHLLSDVLDEGLDFLETVVRRPAFEEHEVERVRQERLDEIDRERDEADVVADHVLIEEIFGEQRYGRPVAGTRATVSAVDRAAIRRHHGRRYSSTDAALVICGDVTRAGLENSLPERFGGWAPGDGRADPAELTGPAADPDRVVVVNRPGSAQAEIRLGAVGTSRGSEDYYDLLVVNAILGGLFNSRINMNLREDKGWTYGARTAFHFRRTPGPFVGRAAVETGATAPAISEFFTEIRGITRNPPGEEEIRLAKNALTLSLPRQFETAGQVGRKVATQVIYGLGEDYWERYRENVEAVTREGIVDAAERYLRRESLVPVVVTEAESVTGALQTDFARVEVRSAP